MINNLFFIKNQNLICFILFFLIKLLFFLVILRNYFLDKHFYLFNKIKNIFLDE